MDKSIRSRYPPNWPELSQACREQAGWKCESCGVTHLGLREHDTIRDRQQGKVAPWWKLVRARRHATRRYKAKINAAHLDHDPENPHPRLAALCDACHGKNDASDRAEKVKKTNRQKRYNAALASGQLELFPSQ